MRPTDRLFQIIQALRRSTRPITAAALADELGVSKRTIYRDIAELMGQHVPIEGEAGFGYLLRSDYDMPPLMLTLDEIEAVVLGAQWVEGRGDAVLSRAARDVMSKIASVVPQHLRTVIAEPSVGAKPTIGAAVDSIDTSTFRSAIRGGRKLGLCYRSEAGAQTARIVWPVMLGYSEATCLLIAWCELRQDFRHFRVDRVTKFEMMKETNGLRKGELRHRYLVWREENLRAAEAAVHN
ncbi:MAG: helix-turn-helix transcriptional regulator [Janthinobacterium lividum]